MSKYSSTISYNIQTTLDASGIAKLQAEIRNVEAELARMANQNLISNNSMQDASRKLQQLRTQINSAFNANLGMLDTKKFTDGLKSANLSLVDLQSAFKTAGTVGEAAFVNTLGRLGKLDTGIKSVSKTTEKIFNTIGNTVRWGVVASGFQTVLNSAHQTVQYVQDLDESLTNIMMVTQQSKEQMNEFAQSANDAAKALSSTTINMTDAALVFAQQGFNTDMSSALAERSTQLANISQQDTPITSDQITTIMNAYDFTGNLDKIDQAMDSWANVANVSAADVGELATAAQKAASTANTTGVSLDQLNAQIATIESVTREAPENIGNALKTIYSRFADISMGNTLEDGVNLGSIAETLGKVGVEVLNDEGRMNNVGDIMEQLMEVWEQLDQTQKNAISTVIAGRYQLSRFQALMNRSDLYQDYLGASENAEGVADQMQEIYANSMEGRLNKLQASAEGIFNDIFNTDDFYKTIDALSEILDLTNQWVNALGGGGTVLQGIGAIATRVFSNNIAQNLNQVIQNRSVIQQQAQNRQNALSQLERAGINDISAGRNQSIIDFITNGLNNATKMSTEQQEAYNKAVDTTISLKQKQAAQENEILQTQILMDAVASSALKREDNKNLINSDYEDGVLKVSQSGLDTIVPETMEDMKTILPDITSALQTNTIIASSDLDRLKDSIKTLGAEGGSSINDLNRIFDNLIKYLGRTSDLFSEDTQTAKQLQETIGDLKAAFAQLEKAKGTEVQEQAMKDLISKVEVARAEMNKLFAAASEGKILDSAELFAKRNALAGTDEQVRQQEDYNAEMGQSLDAQSKIATIASATGAVSQLAFTWQSFQSLGSLWANADTGEGEKILQTVMNLLINLPMLISSISEMKRAVQELSRANMARTLTETASSAVTASTGNSLFARSATTAGRAATAMGAGARVASVGIGLLSKALKFMSSPIGIIISLLSAAASAFISFKKASDQASLDAGMEKYNNAQAKAAIDTSSFEKAYKEYQKTGQASDELKTASQQLVDSLEIVGGQALVNSGNFDKLAKSIKNTTLENGAYLDTLAENQINAETQNLSKYNIFGSGFAQEVADNYLSQDDLGQKFQQATGITFGALGDDTSGMNAVEKIQAINNALEETNEKIENLKTQQSSYNENDSRYQKIQDQIDEEQEFYDFTSGISGKYFDNISQILQQQAQRQESSLAPEDFSGMGYDQVFSVLTNKDGEYSDIATYYASLGEEDGKAYIEALISSLTAENETLAVDQAQKSLISSAYDRGKSFIETHYAEQAKNTPGVTDTEGYYQTLLMRNKGEIDSYAQDFADNVKSTIENSGIGDDVWNQLFSNLDENILLDNLNEIINLLNNGYGITDIVLRYKLAPENEHSSNYLDDSEIASLAKELDVSTEDIDNYKEALSDSNNEFAEYADRMDKTNKALKEQQKSFDSQSDEYKTLEKEINENNQALDSMAAKLYESAKGAEELSTTFDNAAEILRDTSSSTYEQVQAIDSLTPGLEHLLNLDMSNWSEDMRLDFVKQNLDDIQAAINGDTAALQRLRGEAAQKILINVGIDENTEPNIWNQMTSLIAWANANLPDLQAGASIDDGFFLQQLENMVNSAIAAGYNVSDVLEAISEMGIDANFKYKQGTIRVPKQTGVLTYQSDEEGANPGMVTGGITYEEVPAQLPYIEFTDVAYRGGSSGYTPSTPVGGGGGGSKGGGGGGGSGKSYEPKTKDPVEDELDRYERVNTMLEDAENRYDRLNADRERLTGFDMADDMEKEVELLNRQIALHQEKLEIQKEEAQELRDELSNQYGITFDAEGFIVNYATTHERLVNKVNSLINQYNNTTTEEGQEALEKQIEEAEDALNNFNETYQRYDELWAGDMQETLNTLEDLEDQIEDIRIEMMNTSIEAVDNLQDLQESLNEFNNTFEHFGEDTGLRDAELAASNLATYFDIANESASSLYDTLIQRANDRLISGLLSDDERQRIQQDIAMWENARKQIGAGSMEAGGTGLFDMAFNNMRIIQEQIRQYEETGTSTIFGENSADLYDAAKEAYNQATGLLSDFEGHYEDLHDAILDMIDETAEKIEKRREQYENITDELDHQREIIELIHGDEAYNELNMIYDAQNQNYLASINEMQQTLDYWKELRDQMEEGSEEWEAINEQIMDTQSELNDLVEESLDNLQEKYENTVNNILDQWTSNAFGGTDLDWVAEEWELINRNADYYLDDVNAAYETQKLQGKYLEMLDQTDDLHIQQMISEQMKQQLDYLREKDKLSEYDVAYANAQLEILQKRIALEEAQRNKSQMQLRRDSQGNYSYVYTADEGDVSAAEGDLLDAQNNAYNLSKEQMQQTQADSLSALQDAQQLLNDIWTNANLTLDEKTERTQTVIDSLKEYLAGTAEQLSESEKNIINDFIGMAEMMADENAGRIEDVLEQVKDGNLEAFDIIDDRWSTALSNWLLNLDEFNISTDDSFSQLIENSVEFQENVDSIASEVNQDFSDMGDTISKVTDQTKDLASATSDFINQLESDSGIILKYEDQLESMREKIADTTNEMRAYQQQVNQLQSDLTAKEQENANLSAEIDTLRKENESLKNPGGNGSASGGSNFGGSGYSQNDLAWGIAQNIWTYGWAGGWGNDPTRSGKLTGAYGSGFARQVQDIINQNGSSGNLVNYGSDKFSSYSLIGYDTGGYTGSWNDGDTDAKNGKLAYLHQKELVLNASDTENILKAVDIVRQMVQTLKNSAVTDVFSNIANSFSAQTSTETIEQNVHITAEFPAANSAAEIESALLSLNERAIQYSFRKK